MRTIFSDRGSVRPNDDISEDIDRLIEQWERFHDDVRLAALILGVDFLID